MQKNETKTETEIKSKHKRKYKRRYKPFVRFSIGVARLIFGRKRVKGNIVDEPCVYLCRHLDNRGVIRAFCDLDEVLTPWVLEVFHSYKSARAQFEEYTFSKKQKRSRAFIKIASPICAQVFSKLVRSVGAIPVYRGQNSSRSITTIKQSVRALEEGKRLIIFVDKDYADKEEKESGEIYHGFIAIDELYFKRNGAHVPFVPIRITSDETVISQPLFVGESNAKANNGMDKNARKAEASQEFFDEVVRAIFSAKTPKSE